MTKILLVEDDKSLREIYGVRLLAEGYDIVSAGDGEEALAMAIKERPQLIVSDVMMPKISGFDMLDILRSTTETKDIRVIMMTALSSEDQRARGEALGADRYLVKSQVGIEDVVRTVHEVLADAPVTGQTPAQAFGAPAAPSAVPRSAPPVAPRPVAPIYNPPAPTATASPQAPAPQAPAPQAPAPQAAAPQAAMPTPTAPATPASSAGLPQPTAPFSTPRPSNLGDRIIHPVAAPAAAQDLGSLMDQELGRNDAAPTVAAPFTPSAPAQPAMPPLSVSEPASAPSPVTSPTLATDTPHGATSISFDEPSQPTATPMPQPSNTPTNPDQQ